MLWSCLLLLSTAGYAQRQAVDLPVQAYLVGQWSAGHMTPEGATTAVRQFCQRRVAAALPGHLRGDLQWQHAELRDLPGQGWRFLTYWRQGETRIAARFDLVLKPAGLYLLEVGDCQLCYCTDCEAVDLDPAGPGCACAGEAACTYVMETALH